MGNSENDDIYPLDEIDPDVHFYNELSYNLSSNCRYYHEDVIKMEFRNNKNTLHEYFLVCHINIRSIKSNLESFKHNIECLDSTFPIIGVTETWLSDSNCELFDIPGYNFIEKHRNEKSGGGVGIFCVRLSSKELYRKRVIIKSSYYESTYKRYRNKLRRVLLLEEKRYYAKLFHKNKNNMKKTWLILKNIVNKVISRRVQITFKINDDTIINDKVKNLMIF